MARAPQNFANHVRYVPLFHFVCFGLLFAWGVRAVVVAVRHPSGDTIWGAVLGAGLMLLAWFARAFPIAVQDRVIVLEMGLRLQRVAPELAARVGQFTPAQLIALRFAGDAELPALGRQVLDGKHVRPVDIKKAVRDWQADHLRV